MNTRHYLFFLFISLFLASCSSDDSITDGVGKEGTATVTFLTGDEIQTRTSLNGFYNRQHVTSVHLYVFDANGICIQSNDVNWSQSVGSTATQTYKLSGLTIGNSYTLLAVGLDDKTTGGSTVGSGVTYNLPGAIALGSSLSAAKAVLATGKAQSDIAHSELFAGWITVTSQQTLHATVNLYRRVAGLLGYFKNIPANVTTIQVVLYKNQYQDIPLKNADNTNFSDPNDHGSLALSNSQILLSLPVTPEAKSNTVFDDGHGYITNKQANSILGGAYVLPVEAPSSGYSLQVVTRATDGTVVKTYNIIMQSTVDKNGNTVTNNLSMFPLLANHFYGIGQKSTTEDNPIDLGATSGDIVIKVNPNWESSFNLGLIKK